MRIYKTRLAKTKYHTYIIRSNIEGADILFDNIVVGQIDNGIYYHKIKEDEDTGNHTVQLQNGTLPVEEVEYRFTALEGLSIDANGGDFIFDDSIITSKKITTTYSFNGRIETLTVENNSCDINAYNDATIIDVPFSPTRYNMPANESLGIRNALVTLVQAESNKRITVTIKQYPGVEHTYTVNSDIEGATVIAGSETVGTINNGTCQFTKWNNKATDLSITLSGGTLVTKEDGYTFEVAQPTTNVSADGGIFDVSTIVTSLVGSYTPKYPAAKICSPDSSVTLNTEYDYDTVDAAYTAVGQVTFAENETPNTISREITITQDDTGAQETVTITQEAGVLHNYTVLSDCEGAQVSVNGTNKGTISNGQFVYSVWNSKAPASVSISLMGGLPSNPATDYTFSISPTSVSFDENGSTKSVTITSRAIRFNYENTRGTCRKDSSATFNAILKSTPYNVNYSASESLSWITTSGSSITASANSTYSSRSGSIIYTQAESNKTATVNVSQEAKSLYTYTVNSNCNGGTVYFNNVRKGTISNGKLVFTDEASSGTVRISGGVPNSTTSYGDWYNGSTSYEYQTGSYANFVSFDSSTNKEHANISHGVNAETDTLYCYAYKYATRQRRPYWTTYRDYTTYNYSAPANKTCQGNSSVTMNYTQSTSSGTQNGGTEYGSWSNYDTVYDTLTISRVGPTYFPSEASKGYTCTFTIGTATGSGANRRYPITVKTTQNTGYEESSRCECDFGNGSVYTRIQVTKAAADIEYVFQAAGTLNPLSASRTSGSSSDAERGGTSFGIRCYKRVGSTITQLGISMDTHSQINDWWAGNGSTYGDNKGTNTGWQVNFSANQSPYVANTNNPFKTHSYTVTMRQAESNKTLNVTVKQYDYYLAFTTSGVGTLNWNFPYTAGNGGNTCWVGCQNGYKSVNWVAGTGANSFGSYDPVRGTNGTQFFFNASANNSFNIRKGSIPFSIEDGNTIHGATINITQQAAPNVFYINGTNLGSGNYAISRGSVTSLNTTGTVPLINVVGVSKCEINSVLTANNSNAVAAPFTAYTSQSFKLWRRTGNTGSWTLVKTFSVSPNGTITA